MPTRLLALAGALALTWLTGCADPSRPLAEAIPAEFRSWAASRAEGERYVVHGHAPYAVQVCLPGEDRRLHGPERHLATVQRGPSGGLRARVVLGGWLPPAPTRGRALVFALPPDYRPRDWDQLRVTLPLAEANLRPDAEGAFSATLGLPDAEAGSRYLISVLLETDAGFLYPGPREVSLPGDD